MGVSVNYRNATKIYPDKMWSKRKYHLEQQYGGRKLCKRL